MKRQKYLTGNSNLTKTILSMLPIMPILLSTASVSPIVIKAYGEDNLDIHNIQFKVDRSDLRE